jgi:predicted transposase/invertase (TIGR01784 family)
MALDFDITEDALYLVGEQRGLEKGLQKGKEEGFQKGKEEVALQMLRKGMALELISEITELPIERLEQLKQQLEAGQ